MKSAFDRYKIRKKSISAELKLWIGFRERLEQCKMLYNLRQI